MDAATQGAASGVEHGVAATMLVDKRERLEAVMEAAGGAATRKVAKDAVEGVDT